MQKNNKGVAIIPERELEPQKGKNGSLMIPKTWMSDKQVLVMMQRTPKAHISTRPAKGGGTWDFVTGVYVKKVLNYVFGWNWDFEIVNQSEKYGQVITTGKLTVKNDKGQSVTKMQVGRADIKLKKDTKIPLDIGNDYKASATDALKKCASELGIASDVYGKNEFKEIGKTTEVKTPIKDEGLATGFECQNCGAIITKPEAEYSKKMFKKTLCRECQKETKK